MIRHFAFFDQTTGAYRREWRGEVGEPSIDPSAPDRQRQLDDWTTAVSQPDPGEVGLDVTQFDYPVGDFCWMTFDAVDRRLDWPEMHTFVEIDLDTLEIVGNQQSPRPIRSHDRRLIVDITDSPLAAYYGRIFGRLVRRAGQWRLDPLVDEVLIPAPTRAALMAAPWDVLAAVSMAEKVTA